MTDKLNVTQADRDAARELLREFFGKDAHIDDVALHFACHRIAHSCDGQGWIVGNGDGTKWRTWGSIGPEWTDDREQATRYARRVDAERVHANDEDAWRIVPHSGEGRSNGEGEAVNLLKELRDNIGAASLVRNPVGISIRERVDTFLRAALAQPEYSGYAEVVGED